MAVKKKNTAIKKSPKHLLGIQNLSILEAKDILNEAKEFIKLIYFLNHRQELKVHLI